MAYGGWPEHEVDHINGDRQDNRLKNLRAATSSENSYNKTIRKDNTSGYKGVYFCKIMKLWCTRVNANKKTHKIGYYSTAEEAGEAYKEAAKKLHGDFANLG